MSVSDHLGFASLALAFFALCVAFLLPNKRWIGYLGLVGMLLTVAFWWGLARKSAPLPVFKISAQSPGASELRECEGFAAKPIFNWWPLLYATGKTCTDLPLIDALNRSAPVGSRGEGYSASQEEHDRGVEARLGDEVFISVYFDNGGDPHDAQFVKNTMRHFAVNSDISNESPNEYTISARLVADDVPSITSRSPHQGGPITIRTVGNTRLAYVPGSAQACIGHDAAIDFGLRTGRTCGTDDFGREKVLVPLSDGILSGGINLGDLPPGFMYSGTVGYLLKVLPAK